MVSAIMMNVIRLNVVGPYFVLLFSNVIFFLHFHLDHKLQNWLVVGTLGFLKRLILMFWTSK
jgi:hypothetical protein